MTEHNEMIPTSTSRERELEIEVARLQAELDTLHGEDPILATSRFLAMAAATVDQTIEAARREADEIVGEVSAQAEARRDEATRVAAEAEAMAERLLAEADLSQATIEEANETAASIKAAAEEEAVGIVTAERQKVVAEVEAFAEVRSALQDERVALESYHETLRQRVQDLADSMVSFMDTELPAGAVSAIERLVPPQLEAALSDVADNEHGHDSEHEYNNEGDNDYGQDDTNEVEVDHVSETAYGADHQIDHETDHETDLETDLETDALVDVDQVDENTESISDSDVDGEPDGVGFREPADPWVGMLESAIPDDAQILEMPDTSIDEIPVGPPTGFGEASVLAVDESDSDNDGPSSSGLFSRARGDENSVLGLQDLAADEAHNDESHSAEAHEDKPAGHKTGLFGMLGARLVQQTPPEELAEALDSDDIDDEAFRQFLDGDDAPDASRDWLLRPDQG